LRPPRRLFVRAVFRLRVGKCRGGTGALAPFDRSAVAVTPLRPHPAGTRLRIERLFNRPKPYRRVATHYENLGRNHLSFIHLAAAMTLRL